jgi:hypothetical protein
VIFGFDEYELDVERCELRREGQIVKADAIVLSCSPRCCKRADN